MKRFLHVLSLAALISVASAANATSSTGIAPVPSTTRYWSCTNTTVVEDPSSSGFWWADLRMGDQYTRCWDSGGNPSNSIPAGMVAWGSWSHNALIQGKGRLLCAHVVPSCGWVTGPAPNTNAP